MIAERFFRLAVHSKAVVGTIVCTTSAFTIPASATLDANMIVGFPSKVAIATARFQNRLSQLNARRYTVLIHFADSNILVLFDISKTAVRRRWATGGRFIR